MCIDRLAVKQLSPRGNSQPHFTSGCAKLSNYRSKLCQKPPLFVSIDGMAGLHPLTYTPTPHPLLVVHLPPCSPGQLDSYQRSWALFFQKANPTPVSRLYTGNRALCAVWVWMQWVQWQGEHVSERGRRLVFIQDQEEKKKKKWCVRGSFVWGFENGHMGTTRQTVFFLVVMDLQRAFWE